jgi:hypothetical protein
MFHANQFRIGKCPIKFQIGPVRSKVGLTGLWSINPSGIYVRMSAYALSASTRLLLTQNSIYIGMGDGSMNTQRSSRQPQFDCLVCLPRLRRANWLVKSKTDFFIYSYSNARQDRFRPTAPITLPIGKERQRALIRTFVLTIMRKNLISTDSDSSGEWRVRHIEKSITFPAPPVTQQSSAGCD